MLKHCKNFLYFARKNKYSGFNYHTRYSIVWALMAGKRASKYTSFVMAHNWTFSLPRKIIFAAVGTIVCFLLLTSG